ncbi:MAG TPA: HAD family hydrolase [Thermoleophilia bacterium]|nr:HAD family hydrolase [Thermoleophilia bacterium]
MIQRLGETSIEIVRGVERGHIRHVLFDFDGTLSLIRDGWQDEMVPLMVEVLEATGTDETRADLEAHVAGIVDRLTGKQTIYQMIQLAEEVRKRGGTPRDPVEYKAEYYRRLQPRIDERIAQLRGAAVTREHLLVSGSLELLDGLRARGMRLYLASGTDEQYVHDEAAVLGVTDYFDGGLFGAVSEYQTFSKARVIKRILDEHNLHGPALLVVGDGFVEIENGRDVGAITLGVYTEEHNRYHMNADKRGRLLVAGADVLAPDFRDHEALLGYLFP